jgi:hypothetical protein
MQPIQFQHPDQRVVELQPWSDADLDDLAQISDSDKERAAAYWRARLPRRLRVLIDAVSTAR